MAYPAVILTIVPAMEVTQDILIPTLVYWLLIPFMWMVVTVLAALFSWPKAVKMVVFVLCICGNTGFLGVPLANALLPIDSIGYVVIYDQFGTFLCLSTFVIFLIAKYQSSDSTLDVKKLLFKLVFFTPFTVLMVSLFLPISPFIKPVLPVLEGVGYLIVPAAITVIGLQFTLRIPKQYIVPMAVLLSIKLLFLPAIVRGVLHGFHVDSVIAAAVVFQVAAAPMITAAVLLSSAKIASPLVNASLGLGTILSFVSLPLWALLLA